MWFLWISIQINPSHLHMATSNVAPVHTSLSRRIVLFVLSGVRGGATLARISVEDGMLHTKYSKCLKLNKQLSFDSSQPTRCLVYHVIMLHLFALSHSFHLFHINSCKHHQRTYHYQLAAFKLHKTNEHKRAYERKNSRCTIIENEISCLYRHLTVIARFVWSLILCSCFTVSKFYLLLLRAIAPL
jgi:hypothetical protein